MEAEGSYEALRSTSEFGGPHGGSDDEDSFVVLETSTSISENSSANGEVLPLFRSNKVREMQNIIKMELSQISSNPEPEVPPAVDALEAVASSVARITISPDSSYEEIQKQVEELIKENETLKNIIAQNNTSMKTQYDRFLNYRDEVTNVMKSYKEKFNEAKICIEKFKEENAKLVGELEVYINIKKLHEEEILNLKEKTRPQDVVQSIAVTTSANEINRSRELQTELINANLKIKELLSENENLKPTCESLKRNIELLQTKLTEANGEIDTLNRSNKLLTKAVENIPKLQQELSLKQQNIDKLTERLVHTPRVEEQLQVLKFDVTTKDTEIARLRKETEELRSKLSNVSKESEKLVQSASTAAGQELTTKDKQIQILHEQLDLATATEASLKEEIAKLTQECRDLEERYAQLSQTFMDSEKKIRQKELEIDHLQEKLDNVSAFHNEENAKLRNKLKMLQDKYNPGLEEDYVQVRSQLSISQKTITALELEQQRKIEEVEKLRKLLLENENNEIFALKEQLQVFKNDFEAEKESKVSIKRERDQIADDLKNLQKRMKQMQNELEILRAKYEPKPEGYNCPKCTFRFNSYQSLENHVHRCLELDQQ